MRCTLCTSIALGAGVLLLAASPSHATDPKTDNPEESPGFEVEADPSALEPEAPPRATDVHHDDDVVHDLDAIVITATPLEHDQDELAIPVDQLDREELLQELGATLGETLGARPGISTSGFSGGASRPVIRGQDAFRTEVTEDGLSTQDVSRESPDHAVPVNPLSVQRIEVVRGPATLRYGGGASAGVVNALTNRVPDTLPAEPVTGEIYGGLASVDGRREVALDLDGGVGPVAWHLDGLLRDSRDYRIPERGRQNGTFADSFAGSAGASWFIGEQGRFGVAYSRYESEYGIPEEDEDARIEMNTNRVRWEGDWDEPTLSIRQIRLRGAWSGYEHDEIVDGVVGQTYLNDQFDGRLELLHEPLFGFLGAVGVTGQARDFEAGGEAAEYLAPSTTSSGAFYVFEERALVSSLVAELGFRAEGTSVEGTPLGSVRAIDRTFVPLSGSAALVWAPSETLSFGFRGGAAQRAPSQVELFARGPHEATGTFEIGDAGFDEETSFAGELRATVDAERFRVEAAGFVTFYRDYVFGQLTGVTVDEDGNVVPSTDPDALDQLIYRSRDALFAGGELSARIDLIERLWGTFGVDGQFDYVRARFTSGQDRNVPRIPPIRWGMNLFYRGDWVRGRFGFLRWERQDDVSNFETATDAFVFLNLSVTLSLEQLYPRVPVEFTLQGTNLLDQKGRNVVSFNAQEVLLPGRNLRGTVRVRF